MSEHAHAPVCAPIPLCVSHQDSNELYVHATIDLGRLEIRHIRAKSLKASNRRGENKSVYS